MDALTPEATAPTTNPTIDQTTAIPQESEQVEGGSNENSTHEPIDTKASMAVEEEYQLKCPDFVPQEEVKAHVEAFKTAGVDPKTAQKVVDLLIERGQENEKLRGGQLSKSLEEDKKNLQKELGSEYETRERDISHLFHQQNIPDEEVKSLISVWGFQKTFKFFDRFSQMNKETSAGDTFAKKESASSSSSSSDEDFFTSEFGKKVLAGDREATGRVLKWAKEQIV